MNPQVQPMGANITPPAQLLLESGYDLEPILNKDFRSATGTNNACNASKICQISRKALSTLSPIHQNHERLIIQLI